MSTHAERMRTWTESIELGAWLVCRENSYIPDRVGLVVEVTDVRPRRLIVKVVADPSDRIDSGTEGYVIQLPIRARDVLELTTRKIRYTTRNGQGELTVEWCRPAGVTRNHPITLTGPQQVEQAHIDAQIAR